MMKRFRVTRMNNERQPSVVLRGLSTEPDKKTDQEIFGWTTFVIRESLAGLCRTLKDYQWHVVHKEQRALKN